MTYAYALTINDDDRQLLTELTAYHRAATYPTPIYVDTPYGTMPLANWQAYQAATAD